MLKSFLYQKLYVIQFYLNSLLPENWIWDVGFTDYKYLKNDK